MSQAASESSVAESGQRRTGASLSVRGLVRRYGTVHAVDDLDLDVEAGTFLTLLGASGCGKSTTLSLVAGLDRPDAGTIHLGEQDITDLPPNERGMAMVFQSYALYPHMTVAENIAFGLKLKRRPKAEITQRVGAVAAMLDLSHLLERRPSQLSGGQQQRVGLGRALVKQPRVFLLDEPFSNLDAALRARMRTEIKHLHLRLGTTSIFVTHDQEEAMSLSDRIAVMRDGKVVQFGTQDDIYLRPATLYIATFVGRPRMSLMKGTLTHDHSGGRFSAPGIDLPVNVTTEAGRTEAVLGLRSEDVRVHNGPAESWAPVVPGATLVPAKVVLLEPMGSDTFVELLVGDQSIVARVAPSLPLSIGQDVALEFVIDRVHLFDAASEERLAS